MHRTRTRGSARACAVLLASVLGATGAPVIGGGPESTAEAARATYMHYNFGARSLRFRDRGADVRTLNWVLRSQGRGTYFHGGFDRSTNRAVRRLQRSAGIRVDGIVGRVTRKAIAARMRHHRATWYGPGLYGNRTACGGRLRKRTIGVAHRKLPCGTRVAFAYKGRWVRAKVIDRGPYRKGYRWDLTRRLAKRLGVLRVGTPTLKTAVAG